MKQGYQHILLVENDLALLNILDFRFSAAKFQTTCACDGHVALEAARKHKFDVVLSDYNMPIVSGVDLIRRLREIPKYAETPCFLMSALCRKLDLPTVAEGLNVQSCFSKPFSPLEVVSVIRSYLEAQSMSVACNA